MDGESSWKCRYIIRWKGYVGYLAAGDTTGTGADRTASECVPGTQEVNKRDMVVGWTSVYKQQW
jgi:hypothetical protein